jgi:hypothetical protein
MLHAIYAAHLKVFYYLCSSGFQLCARLRLNFFNDFNVCVMCVAVPVKKIESEFSYPTIVLASSYILYYNLILIVIYTIWRRRTGTKCEKRNFSFFDWNSGIRDTHVDIIREFQSFLAHNILVAGTWSVEYYQTNTHVVA